ncbi:purine-nucleoside phosphorylase [Levilactobacillus acidifarinae]|uniref:Purine nucleoside phosphorylase DeoD-type n=1 Tax=Levilactobacillus acidifarinae DSM 19394 = JCM 15949 TaxID=1423715 RepID=A0A0R1LMJ5_9LACO|nr:purine-nucleoside phosphorylase [Levilactobacillus acidifarinae]KRK96760.1 purine nucleoside phosphorylase [Levilactobacillus acidifarinae DSM 19394]GEO69874.1 purine nucleoside phosphorylase DeoD-type [Levilactobacillus acidifarinae]
MSNHLEAKQGDIADTVLMPGDPLRAKYIAETYLDNPVCYNKVRNAFGYTGTYKGHRISVQGTGMGIPSISIYAHELVTEYGAKKLFRVGTSGGMSPDVHVRDVVLAQAATTDSSIIHNIFGGGIYYAPISDFGLLDNAYHAAKELNIPVKVGNVLAEDRFYNDEMDRKKLVDYGVIATEMESAALFLIAAKYHVKAMSVLTISNHLITGESTTPEEREKSFDDMIKVALEAAIR